MWPSVAQARVGPQLKIASTAETEWALVQWCSMFDVECLVFCFRTGFPPENANANLATHTLEFSPMPFGHWPLVRSNLAFSATPPARRIESPGLLPAPGF